jgi:hypothetical protein
MEELMGLRAERSTRWIPACAIALALAFAAPAMAAKTKTTAPTASTGGAAPVTPTTALLHGAVNPNGHPTTYFFQYGGNSLYGATTPPASAGAGKSAISVTAGIGTLAPNTVYHYRIVAQWSGGLVKGKDQSFRTQKQPLALSLAGVPNPAPFGGPVTISGALTGTGAANREVVLQSNAFPFTQGFVMAANPQITNAQGGFAWTFVSVPVTTQYRVYLAASPAVASPVLTLGVSYRVNLATHAHNVRRGSKINFSGTLQPGTSGVQMVIQRRRHGTWTTVGSTLTRYATGAPAAKFNRRVRIRRGGFYRVEARSVGGNYVTADSGMIFIHAR